MGNKLFIGFIKNSIRFIINKIITPDKFLSELKYWRKVYKSGGNSFNNSWYINIMLPMSGETTDSFLKDKVVADFGCGPAGSLTWAVSAKERIGIDVLADQYSKYFDLTGHNMKYVNCTESYIPLEDDTVDLLYTLNAMDHTKHFEIMSKECLRILKPGGLFTGSFNLNEIPTATEPQMLTEAVVKKNILNYLECISYRLTKTGVSGKRFDYFFRLDDLPSGTKKVCMLWIRGYKK
jgi:ubiquinone/menaquinone biosynthesis C-methylase UbiE